MSTVAWTVGSERYATVARVLRGLASRCGPAPLRILDAGGGDGHDAVGLALIGHDVVVLDRDESALAAARGAARIAGVQESLRTVAADLDDLPRLAELVPRGGFDLVLCHDVLPERGTQARGDVAALTATVRPGGLLSLVGAAPGPGAGLPDLDPAAVEDALLAAGCATVLRAQDVGSVLRARPTAEDGHRGYWHLVGRRDGPAGQAPQARASSS